MDLLSTIRKEGSRGGVDFKWSDVSTSQHRENYLGHSLMAPVGRWQKGRDLNWYAKADPSTGVLNETADEKRARERKEEIRRIKEAEEDALARALGLPVPERSTVGTGANGIDVGEVRRVIKETEAGDDEIDEVGRGRGFGGFVGNMDAEKTDKDPGLDIDSTQGGLLGRDGESKKQRRSERRSRSRSRERKHRHHRHRSRSRDARNRYRRKDENRHRERREPRDRTRSRSPERRDRRRLSRSPERRRDTRERRDRGGSPRRERRDRRERSWSPRNEERQYSERDNRNRDDSYPRPRRSWSPDPRDRERRPDRDSGRRR
jgi:Multiple myeloma tumor-associated